MASPVVAMNVYGSLKATDVGFIGSLAEPLQTIGRHAIPDTQSLFGLASAATRVDRLEIELRGKLIDLLVNKEPMDALVHFYKSSLDFCVHLIHFCELGKDERYSDMAVRKLPLLLLEDILDGLSLRDCKYFWEYAVEPNLETLYSNLFWKKSTVCHLPFLKVCNKFLRLLEMGPAPEEWTGRVLWTLSRGFGIADKSATKVWGSFHTANVTAFDAPKEFHGGNKNQEYSLYQAFWSLQKEFSNPNTIQVADFLKKMRIVLAALESTHKATNATSEDSLPPPPCPTTPKYLTSSSLLPLQLATPDFRIHVLTQFLIVASHLSSESPPLANALSTLQLRAKQLLRKDQEEHLQILEAILQREQHWRAWKKTKCKDSAFAPQYSKDEETPKKKRRMLLDGPLGDDEDQDHQQGHDFTLMDADELATISKSMVEAVPTLDQHLESYVDALDPDAGIEAEYHPKNDPIFSWRAMRLYTKHQLPLLHMCSKSGDFERMTRKYYQGKGKEIPGIIPDASDEGSVSSEETKAEEEESKVEENEPEAEKEEHHSKADEGEEEEDVERGLVDKYKESPAAYEPEADDGEEDGDDEEPMETHETLREEPVEGNEEDRESQESVEEDGAQPMKVEDEPQTQNIKEDDDKKSTEPRVDSSNVKQDDGEVEEVVSDSVSRATSDSDEEKEEEIEQTVKQEDEDQAKSRDGSRDRERPPANQEQQGSYRNSGSPPGRHGGRNPHPRGRGGPPARGRSDEGRGGREPRGRGGRRPGRGGGGRVGDDGGGRGGDDRRGDDRGGRGGSRRGPGPREDHARGERRGGRDDNDDRRWRGRR